MGSNVEALAETARRAVEVGAPLVDLNFGCPAKGALRGCAGSALLREPSRLEHIVRACVDAVGDTPLTGKIRAGYDDDTLLEDLARAVEAGGASMLTIHCRTRAEAYCDVVDWTRIERAVQSVTIPVCGNGGVSTHADLERMRNETGCALVMVGRAALGDPWIFSGRRVDSSEAAAFLLEYAQLLLASGDAGVKGAAARVKQLLNHWTAGDFVTDRTSWLRESDPERLLQRLERVARDVPARLPA
jgi:tRNA-dihydrouridine synthase C